MLEQMRSAEQIMCPSPRKETLLEDVVEYLRKGLKLDSSKIRSALNAAPRNVRAVLQRHVKNLVDPDDNRPVWSFLNEEEFLNVLGGLELRLALTTIARVWDKAHVEMRETRSEIRDGKPYHAAFSQSPYIDLQPLIHAINRDQDSVHKKIKFESTYDIFEPIRAVWEPCSLITHDDLPRPNSLAAIIPGEVSQNGEYAGIGGGGGSDVISASILGRLLSQHDKRTNLLVSTRTWATRPLWKRPWGDPEADSPSSKEESNARLSNISWRTFAAEQEPMKISRSIEERRSTSVSDECHSSCEAAVKQIDEADRLFEASQMSTIAGGSEEAKKYGDINVQDNGRAHIGDQYVNYNYYFNNSGGTEHRLNGSGYNSYENYVWQRKRSFDGSHSTGHEYYPGPGQARSTQPPPHASYIPQFLNHNPPMPNLLDSMFNILNDTIGSIVSTALQNIMPLLAMQLQAVAHWPISPLR